MQHDFEKHLWDIHNAGIDVLEYTHGKDFVAYQGDSLLRAGVERKFSIIGEAVRRLRHQFPEESKQIQHADEIIAFRNTLAHEDDSGEDRIVWDIVERELPILIAEVTVLLDEWHQG